MRLLADWLESNSSKSRSKIIIAADFTGPYESRVERAAELIYLLRDRIVAVKVNWHLLLPYGVFGLRELIEVCQEADLPLIADVKLNDIGSTNLEVAETLFSNGFDAIIANPFVGLNEGLAGVLATSRKMGKSVILLVYMSHEGAREGYGLTVHGEPLYAKFAKRTKDWGADGAIVSCKSPAIIRKVRSFLNDDQLILSPGVGFQGGDGRKALTAGTDYLIVGRSILESRDPVKSVDALNLEFQKKK